MQRSPHFPDTAQSALPYATGQPIFSDAHFPRIASTVVIRADGLSVSDLLRVEPALLSWIVTPAGDEMAAVEATRRSQR